MSSIESGSTDCIAARKISVWSETLKKPLVAIVACLLTINSCASLASTASQREYKRGFADCSAGRWDENQHGASYKEGCAAAEAKRDAGGSAPPPATSSITEPKVEADAGHIAPRKDKQACIRAVRNQTKNAKIAVVGAETSEANNQIIIAVGSQRARWKCLVKRGKVAEVMSLSDEGAL